MPSADKRKSSVRKKWAQKNGSISSKTGSLSHIRFLNGENCDTENENFFGKVIFDKAFKNNQMSAFTETLKTLQKHKKI